MTELQAGLDNWNSRNGIVGMTSFVFGVLLAKLSATIEPKNVLLVLFPHLEFKEPTWRLSRTLVIAMKFTRKWERLTKSIRI